MALSHPLAWAHLATSIADWLPLLGRHSVQQEALVPHFFWQSSRAERHLGSFWQVAHWVGHFYSMHFWGSSKVANCWVEADDESTSSKFIISAALSHPLAWAHLATSIADWLPLLGRHSVQQEALVPHFFWQSSRAERHLGSFWQVAHWVGHFYSMHFWGSASVYLVISMANESKAIDNMRMGIFIVDFISI